MVTAVAMSSPNSKPPHNYNWSWYSSSSNINSKSNSINHRSRTYNNNYENNADSNRFSQNGCGPNENYGRSMSPTNIDFESIEPYDLWKEDYDANSTVADTFEPFPLAAVKPSSERSRSGNNNATMNRESDSHAVGGSGYNSNSNNNPYFEAQTSGQILQISSNNRKRKKKPNGMPKRPLSAYNLFFQAERAKILNDSSSPEGGDKDGESTADCSAEDKLFLESFQGLIDAGAAEGEGDPEKDLNPSSEPSASNNGTATKTSASTARRRAPHGKIGFSDLGKCIGARWKNLPSEEKKKYQDLALEESERYRREMKTFKRNKLNADKSKKRPLIIDPFSQNEGGSKFAQEGNNVATASSSSIPNVSHYLHKSDNTKPAEVPTTQDHNSFYHTPNISENNHSSAHTNYQLLPPRMFENIQQHQQHLPPHYTVNLPSTNGPRPYHFTYAAVPMSPRSAERYLATVTKQQDHSNQHYFG